MSKKQDIKYIVLTIGLGSICCVTLGALFFGSKIFNKELPFFQIASLGLVGSVAFSLFYFKRYRDAIYVLIMLFIINIIIANLTKASFVIIHFLYFSSVIVAVFLFSKYFFIQIANMKISRPLVLASILALFLVMATGLQWVIFAKDGMPFYPLGNLPIGFLIGLGLGIGFELSDYIYSKKILS
jgi:hypothetical protein